MDVEVQRPMTHDLLGSVIGNLGASIKGVVVSELKDDTFFAKILVDFRGNVIEIDSRPSDALALAVRSGAPIFAEDSVVEMAGITLEDNVAGDESDSDQLTGAQVYEEELEKLSAFTDFVDTLDLEDLGSK